MVMRPHRSHGLFRGNVTGFVEELDLARPVLEELSQLLLREWLELAARSAA